MGNHPNDFDDRWGGVHTREDLATVKKVLKTVNGVRLPADQELPKQCPTHDCDWWPVTTSTGVYMHCPLCYNQGQPCPECGDVNKVQDGRGDILECAGCYHAWNPVSESQKAEEAAWKVWNTIVGHTTYDVLDTDDRERWHRALTTYASLSQWVNVEERMPTLDGEYWCHVEPKNPFLSEIHGYDDGLITPKFDPYERTVKTFRTNAGELRFNCGGLERVTFWMSLPKFLPESFNKEEL
jgi:hypothetical protein